MSDVVSNVTPSEVNKNLLSTHFKFKNGGYLKPYIRIQTGVRRDVYTLGEVLTILKNIIREECLFDTKNPSVILCSKPLEKAINMKALHVTEIRDLILQQLVEANEDEIFRNQLLVQSLPSHTNSYPFVSSTGTSDHTQSTPPALIRDTPISNSIFANKEARFYLKPAFLNVMRSCPSLTQQDKEKTIFTYEEVSLRLYSYIISRKNKLFDARNIKLALVHDDPLGVAFGVKAFHRCQVNTYLKAQLIPVESSNKNDGNHQRGFGSQSSSGLPAFPSTSKADSTPSGLVEPAQKGGQGRKRSSSGEQEMVAKMARSQSYLWNQVIKTMENTISDTDTEADEQIKIVTIETIGSNDTIHINGDSIDLDSSDEDVDDTVDRVYEVEYDIVSSEEEERPPQANGVGNEFSSASDTDTEADEQIKIVPHGKSTVDNCEDFADGEDDLDNFVITNPKVSASKCVSCGEFNENGLPKCNNCWEIRNNWVERPKTKRKHKKNSAHKNLNETLKTDTELFSQRQRFLCNQISVSEDETDGGSMTTETEDRPRFDSLDSGIGSQEMEILSSQSTSLVDAKFNKSMESLNMDDLEDKKMTTIDLLNKQSNNTVTKVTNQTFLSLCEICCKQPKNASLIHGKLGHQVCCYTCGKKLWKKQSRCPVCRRVVEKIVKIIQA